MDNKKKFNNLEQTKESSNYEKYKLVCANVICAKCRGRTSYVKGAYGFVYPTTCYCKETR